MLEFALDFTDTITSPWNREAAYVFTDEFIKSKMFMCKDARLIREAFKSHFQTLRKKYERQLKLQEPYGHLEVEKQQSEDARKKRRKNVSVTVFLWMINMFSTFSGDNSSSSWKEYTVRRCCQRPRISFLSSSRLEPGVRAETNLTEEMGMVDRMYTTSSRTNGELPVCGPGWRSSRFFIFRESGTS